MIEALRASRPPRRARLARRALLGLAGVVGMGFGPPLSRADDADIELGRSHLRVKAHPDLTVQTSSREDCRFFENGTLASSTVEVSLWVYSKDKWPFKSPEDVARNVEGNEKNNLSAPAFRFASSQAIGGPYGLAGYAVLATADTPDSKQKTGEVFVVCGLLDQHGYYLRASATPALAEPARDRFLEYVRSAIVVDSPDVDPKWSDGEARARWATATRASPAAKTMKPPTRTAHYIVLTNSGAGARLGGVLEKDFEALRKAFPDDPGAKHRLLPVFLFAKQDEYWAYYMAETKRSMEQAKGSSGVALLDSYATFDGTTDAEHMRGATSQYFRNYLGLEQGGYWFRKSIAKFMFMPAGDLRAFATDAARRRTYTPFPKLFSHEGHNDAEDVVPIGTGASLIAFLKGGTLKPDRFMDFVRRVGAIENADASALDPILRELYDVDVAGLEAAWRDYWAK